MIDGLKPYPAMKDSGVAWLGQVPAHWDVIPNRAAFTEVNKRDCPAADMLSVTINKGVIRQQVLLEGSSKKDSSNQDKSAYKLVRPGDIVYNKMRAWQGAVGVSEHEGIVSPAYVVQRPRPGADAQYLHYLLRTPAFAREAERWSYGITSDMWSLRPEHFRMIYSCLPPIHEQAAIVRFLDHADRRIRRYSRAKQKLIALLEEQKQAIVHRAVTRGLDPNVRLKPSGVIGWPEIPTSYERVRLGRACSSIRDGTHNPPAPLPGVHRLLSVRKIVNGQFVVREDDRTMTADAFEALQRSYTIDKGDVVIALVGATTGKSAVVGDIENVTVQRSIGILRPDRVKLRSAFLHLLIGCELIQGQIRQVMNKYAAQPGIYLDELARIEICFPDLSVQDSIVREVERKTVPLDVAARRTKSAIQFLREYRTRLIADVVTGKLDVREAAARLPEEGEEDREPESLPDVEPIDDAEALQEEAGV